MSLLGVRGSGCCTGVGWGAVVGRSSGTFNDSYKDPKPRVRLRVADDSVRSVSNDAGRSGSHNHGENCVRGEFMKGAFFSLGRDECSWLDKNKSYRVPRKKIYRIIMKSARMVAEGDFCRSEFGDTTEPRTVVPTDEAVSAGIQGKDVKVIGVGARACAILNFCQQTSLLPYAQFWKYDSDTALQNLELSDHLEAPASLPAASGNEDKQGGPTVSGNNSGTLFLVLGIGSGTELGCAPRQLKAAKAKGWLVVSIFIQPFTFEGQKRSEQANQLVKALLECTDVVLVVKQDAWLKGEAVTVSDATDIANNAVFLSIIALSEFQASLRNTGKAWLGSGKGRSVRDAVETSLVDSPPDGLMVSYISLVLTVRAYLYGGKSSVLCTLASAHGRTRDDLSEAAVVLRRQLGSEIRLVCNAVTNPLLEPGVTLATVIRTRSEEHLKGEKYQKDPSSFRSSGNNFRSILNNVKSSSTVSPFREKVPEDFLRKSSVKSEDYSSVSRQEELRGKFKGDANVTGGLPDSRKENRRQQGRTPLKRTTVRSSEASVIHERRKGDARQSSSQPLPASLASQKSSVTLGWESGPGSAIAEAWAQARANAKRPPKVASGSDLDVPVGVRLWNDKPGNGDMGSEVGGSERLEREAPGPVPVDPEAVPRNRVMDIGLGAMMDMYNAASALVTGKEAVDERKPPSLTQRASSMLETERSQKELTPMVEMVFKNGIYKGRCLAGLPDGKGRLSFSDGSFYDGQWKQGKRVGAGTFYFANGDLYQGTWKGDVVHGKGWMYYHNGDRLHADFWKGKAHGEGRFYSAQGDVFLGHFRDNLRHGECLHIEASGVRWMEVWKNGTFVSRTPDDS
ncbi:hypothetical protein R1sor_008457 [Riccia sorocarpa]|uniref:Tubulin/FtsZ GTPase domain-containing protein n=1 Tax=Riccia sorocarpa TaxID=122646 RepID=A0ABD3HVL0_9MARC